jgi:large subunit ribosomal protein L5
MSRYQKKYKEEILPELKKRHPERNVMALPRLKKIVIAMGISEAAKDKTALQSHVTELALLSGQKPIITRAKVAISNFKLKENQPIGLVVTLRGKKMFDFLDRFCNLVTPRIRDFRGFKTNGDGRGNFSVGLSDQQVFPEIILDNVIRPQGMHVTFVTSAQNDEDSFELMKMFGFPFK